MDGTEPFQDLGNYFSLTLSGRMDQDRIPPRIFHSVIDPVLCRAEGDESSLYSYKIARVVLRSITDSINIRTESICCRRIEFINGTRPFQSLLLGSAPPCKSRAIKRFRTVLSFTRTTAKFKAVLPYGHSSHI